MGAEGIEPTRYNVTEFTVPPISLVVYAPIKSFNFSVNQRIRRRDLTAHISILIPNLSVQRQRLTGNNNNFNNNAHSL